MKKKISVDFDNVLYNLEELNVKSVKEIYGVQISTIDILNWDFYPDNYPKITEIWGDWSRYSKGNFFSGDKLFIDYLKEKYEVQIVTASYDSITKEKDKMIYERYGDLKIIHSGKNCKSIFTKKSCLIDDGLHNIKAHIEKNNMPSIIVDIDYGWNQGFESSLTYRASSFESIIQGLSHFKY